MKLSLNMIQTTALAVVVYHFGDWLKSKIKVLEKFCIPAPVVGGLIIAFINLILNQTGVLNITFDTTLEQPAMILFFTSVGFKASLDLVKKGGLQVGLFWFVATVVAVFQNVISILIAKGIDIDPLLAIICGSVTMIGGHGTGAAFGNLLENKYGLSRGVTAAMAAATFGLVIGSLIGGPLGKRLVERHNLKPKVYQSLDDRHHIISLDNQTLDSKVLFKTLMTALIAMAFGSVIEVFFTKMNITLPAYIGSMIVATIILNFGKATGAWHVNTEYMDVIGNVALNIFLSIALMTLKLWELAHVAAPMLIILIAQTIFMLLVAYFAVFRIMGKDYDAAIMSAGMCGFGMGATPNGIANMEAVSERYGPAPRAFFVISIVGAFLIDITNSISIIVFVNLLI